MAFGLTQWLISFAIFLIVLTVITWSAVHLGKKSQNSTNMIILRFLDADDYSIDWENKSLHSTIVHNSTSRVIESTDSPTLFASNQGSEITDSALFYNIWRTYYSTEDAVNTMKDETPTAIFASSTGNESMWNDNTTLYNTSNRIFVSEYRRNVSEKVTSSDHTL